MYFLRRLLFLPPLLLLVSALAFGLMHALPGGPFDRERAPASEEIKRNLERKFHLDEPVWRQYLRYLGLLWETDPSGGFKRVEGGLIAGDFGPSFKYRDHSVTAIIRTSLPVSMALGACAFLFALGVGIPLGCFTAVKRGQWGDHLGSFLALLAFCIPALVVGPVLVMIFAVRLRWFPPALWGGPSHLVLPTIALGLYFAGRVSRLMREGMTQVLREPFITTARAKGLSESTVLWKHGFRLAVLPVVSYSGPLLADLLTGSFIVETVFQIPGIGPFLVNSIFNKDATLTVGLVLLYAVLLVVLNLAVDFAYGLLDRRVRHG